jgi:hypothetical protein
MSMTIESTSDTAEQVAAAYGQAKPAGATAEAAKDTVTAEPIEAEQGEQPEAKAAGADEGDDDEADGEQPKKKGGFQRRITKLTTEKRELEARLAALTAGKPAEKPAETPKADAGDGKPQLEKCASYEEYVEALTDWTLAQREAAAAEKAKADAAKAEQAELAKSWQARQDATRAKYSDYDEVVGQEIPITQVMQQALLESDHGAELAYWLGSNPEEANRIAKLGPVSAIKALAKIEDSLSGGSAEPPAKPKPRASSAPEPISPLGARSSASVKDPDKMSFAEFKAWREAGGGR